MMTPVERVLALRGIGFLQGAQPRQLLGLANVAREVEMWKGQAIYTETDFADALYVVVSGRVGLSDGEIEFGDVPAGQSFGTWSLVDDCHRNHRATCLEDGRLLALDRAEFYEFASGDIAMLEALVRGLARRLKQVAEASAERTKLGGEGL
jgi:CRP-like cAMP-binding protein